MTTLPNRQVCELRGDTRDRLDALLMGALHDTGIGRSALISALVDVWPHLPNDTADAIVAAGKVWELSLRDTAPDPVDVWRVDPLAHIPGVDA